MARLDEHAETIKAPLPALGYEPSEYVTGGRYFQSIEIPEGARLAKAVMDLVGDHVLMMRRTIRMARATFPSRCRSCRAGRWTWSGSGSSYGTTPPGSMDALPFEYARRESEIAAEPDGSW
jgi:hypothetical protein